MSANGEFNGERKRAPGPPPTTEEIYDRATAPAAEDGVLEEVNFGLGNYSKRESYQQVELFMDGLYGEQAFGRAIRELVLHKAKYKLGLYGWEYAGTQYNGWHQRAEGGEQTLDGLSKDEWAIEKGSDYWETLPEDQREQVIKQFADADPEWEPPHHSAARMHHEASRGRGARLLDNLFGRVSVQQLKKKAEKAKGGLLSRGGSE